MKTIQIALVFMFVVFATGCAVTPASHYPHQRSQMHQQTGWYSSPDAAIDHGEAMRSRILHSAPAGGQWTNRGFANDYSLQYRDGRVNEQFRLQGSGRGTIQ